MVERELEELKCYACNGKVHQMCYPCNEEVCQIKNCQFRTWADSYKSDFRESYISIGNEPLNVQRHYFDPDGSYKKKTDHSFYCDLVKFLNRREKEMKEKFPNNLQENFEYGFVERKGIKVSYIDNKGKKNLLFYLRSDQFGFSAPVNEKCYPYDLYIKKHKNSEKAIEEVIKWISMSRTIGGSFLWPELFHKDYNRQRGGTINFRKSRYIQDRVDLTLWEIKDWYSKRNEHSSILKRYSKPDLEHWLRHFGNFETYAEYFMFDESQFVDKSYDPINIITGKSDVPIGEENGKNPKPKITKSMKLGDLKDMLNTLNEKIVKRSIAMTEIIDKENQSS